MEKKRLIDANYVLKKFKNYCENNCIYSKETQNIMCSSCAIGDAIDIVEDAPIIKDNNGGKI